MKASHKAYERAWKAFLAAKAAVPGPFQQDVDEDLPPEIQAVQAAETELREAEEAVTGELEAAWERNRLAVVEAKDAAATARRAQALVEIDCGRSARRRNPRHPVLNQDEIDAIESARSRVAAAQAAATEAASQFKAGVTPEQLVG